MHLHTYSIYYHLFIPEAPGTRCCRNGAETPSSRQDGWI